MIEESSSGDIGQAHGEAKEPDINPSFSEPNVWPGRYDLLDGWRGLAALAVVGEHAAGIRLGHWAVLIFFVISGYCISASANSCQKKGLGLMAFIKRRIRRIYPPYFFALLFFLATRAVKSFSSHTNVFSSWTFIEYVQNFTLTQWVTLISHPNAMAFTNPALMVTSFWTLNYEEQFYLIIAGMLFISSIYRPIRIVHLVAGLGLATAVWVGFFGGLCYGFFMDYWLLFALGSLVYMRLAQFQSLLIRRLVDVSLAILIVFSAVFTCLHPCDANAVLLSGGGRAVFAELLMAGSFAMLLIYTRPLNNWIHRSKIGKGIHFLGKISYSLYLLNQFNLTLIAGIVWFLLPKGSPIFVVAPLMLLLHVSLATVFWFFCERPFLNEPLAETVGPVTRKGDPSIIASAAA